MIIQGLIATLPSPLRSADTEELVELTRTGADLVAVTMYLAAVEEGVYLAAKAVGLNRDAATRLLQMALVSRGEKPDRARKEAARVSQRIEPGPKSWKGRALANQSFARKSPAYLLLVFPLSILLSLDFPPGWPSTGAAPSLPSLDFLLRNTFLLLILGSLFLAFVAGMCWYDGKSWLRIVARAEEAVRLGSTELSAGRPRLEVAREVASVWIRIRSNAPDPSTVEQLQRTASESLAALQTHLDKS